MIEPAVRVRRGEAGRDVPGKLRLGDLGTPRRCLSNGGGESKYRKKAILTRGPGVKDAKGVKTSKLITQVVKGLINISVLAIVGRYLR